MTLAEQLVVVALLGGLGCWGLALGQEQRQRLRVEAVSSELLAGIQLARAEAERRQQACGLSLDPTGWLAPADGSLPACTKALQPFSDGVSLAHSFPATLRFSANGLVIDGGVAVLSQSGTGLRRCLVMALPLGLVRLGRYDADPAGPLSAAKCQAER
jgi:Tfp pilus assembly protein FimT